MHESASFQSNGLMAQRAGFIVGTQHSWQPGDPVIDVDMCKGLTDRVDSLADGSLASACRSGASEVLRRRR